MNKIKLEELTFDKRDEFQRKIVAQKIIDLLQSEIDISPLVIDGTWGKGKTEFCFKLINLMKESDTHHLIYVDAFKADHANEPLMTILSEIINILPDDESKKSLIKKALPAIRVGIKAMAKATVSHVLRQDFADLVNDFDKDIQKVTDKVIDASVESLLNDHIEANKNLATLQTALREITKEKPIVLFIDELDRCRPNFAVELLEVIKHTFDVEGVSFVLITNKQQLTASIHHCYGHNVDAHRYLDKFIKFTINLPDTHTINRYDFHNNALLHYQNLLQQSPILQETKLNADAYLDFIKKMITTHQLSLREIETIIRHLEIYQILTENKGLADGIIFGNKMLRLFSIIVFVINPTLAKDLDNDMLDANKLNSFLGFKSAVTLDEDYLNYYQVFTIMLGQQCTINSEQYALNPSDESRLDDLIFRTFYTQGFPPNKNERIKIVHETLKTLNLIH